MKSNFEDYCMPHYWEDELHKMEKNSNFCPDAIITDYDDKIQETFSIIVKDDFVKIKKKIVDNITKFYQNEEAYLLSFNKLDESFINFFAQSFNIEDKDFIKKYLENITKLHKELQNCVSEKDGALRSWSIAQNYADMEHASNKDKEDEEKAEREYKYMCDRLKVKEDEYNFNKLDTDRLRKLSLPEFSK